MLARPGMSSAKFDALLAAQMADEAKRSKAHFVVDTSGGVAHAQTQVDEILNVLRSRREAEH